MFIKRSAQKKRALQFSFCSVRSDVIVVVAVVAECELKRAKKNITIKNTKIQKKEIKIRKKIQQQQQSIPNKIAEKLHGIEIMCVFQRNYLAMYVCQCLFVCSPIYHR